jgi:hypothetical protein
LLQPFTAVLWMCTTCQHQYSHPRIDVMSTHTAPKHSGLVAAAGALQQHMTAMTSAAGSLPGAAGVTWCWVVTSVTSATTCRQTAVACMQGRCSLCSHAYLITWHQRWLQPCADQFCWRVALHLCRPVTTPVTTTSSIDATWRPYGAEVGVTHGVLFPKALVVQTWVSLRRRGANPSVSPGVMGLTV